MTSLFMGHVIGSGVPADEATVRETAVPYYRETLAAEMDDMPEMGEVETDSNPDLGGLAKRQLASHWVQGVPSSPQVETVTGQNASNQIIASQVSTSGTAAGRELAGHTHTNLSYAVGIEAVNDLADPMHKMSNTYFVRTPRTVQETAGNYMSSPPDHALQGEISAYGKTAARDAAQSALYNSWWRGGAQ